MVDTEEDITLYIGGVQFTVVTKDLPKLLWAVGILPEKNDVSEETKKETETEKETSNEEPREKALKSRACIVGDKCKERDTCEWLHADELFGKEYSWGYVFEHFYSKNICKNGPFCQNRCCCSNDHPMVEDIDIIDICPECGLVSPKGWHDVRMCKIAHGIIVCRLFNFDTEEKCHRTTDHGEFRHIKCPNGKPAKLCYRCIFGDKLRPNNLPTRCAVTMIQEKCFKCYGLYGA